MQKPPPMMFPIVTGIRFVTKKPTSDRPSPGIPYEAETSIPAGMKYMFATQCSKPQMIKSITGSQRANIFPASSSAAKEHHTAMHTKTLHKIPLKRPSVKLMFDFVMAVFTTDKASALSPNE